MIDSRIALGIRPPEFESPMNGLAKMLQLQGLQQANQLNTMQMDEYRAGADEKNALRALYAQPDFDPSTPDGLRKIMRVSPAQGAAAQKAQLDALKIRGEIGKTDAETQAKRLAAAKDRYTAWSTTMGAIANRPDLNRQLAIQTGQQLVDMGVMPLEMFEAGVAKLPEDPEQLRAQLQAGLRANLTPDQLVTLFTPKVSTVDNGQQISRVDDNPNSPTFGQRVGAAPVQKQATPGEVMTDTRTRSEGAANRVQQRRGQDLTDARARDKNNIDAGGGAKKPGPMSAALQKELLESDDAVQSSKSVVSTLRQALKLNDRAYSGYLAKERATAVSNLGGSERADATINIDNMMTGQGLEQMKSIFGAAPTEGERKILLEMQASADKTPAQRKSIMERAIAAAERRGQYAQAKAKAIRAGTYLTEGLPDVQDDAAPAGAATGPRFLGFEQ